MAWLLVQSTVWNYPQQRSTEGLPAPPHNGRDWWEVRRGFCYTDMNVHDLKLPTWLGFCLMPEHPDFVSGPAGRGV